jgi:CBS domain-containing protein
MTRNPTTVQVKEPVASAVRRMREGGYRHLPVVDEAGQPIGMLSAKRIVHYLAEHYPQTIYNQNPKPGAAPTEREGA